MFLLLVDLNSKKDTQRILYDLNRCYPFAMDEVQLGVQQLLGPTNRCMLTLAVEALQVGDAEQLGALMREAQALFDRFAVPAGLPD